MVIFAFPHLHDNDLSVNQLALNDFFFMSSDVKSQMFSCETKLVREKGFVLPKAFKDKPMKVIHVHLKEEQIHLLIQFERLNLVEELD